jgi:hypothetical protein
VRTSSFEVMWMSLCNYCPLGFAATYLGLHKRFHLFELSGLHIFSATHNASWGTLSQSGTLSQHPFCYLPHLLHVPSNPPLIQIVHMILCEQRTQHLYNAPGLQQSACMSKSSIGKSHAQPLNLAMSARRPSCAGLAITLMKMTRRTV